MLYVSESTTQVAANAQQAYFTAKSAISTTVEYIKNNPGEISYLVSNVGRGSLKGMGSYEVTVEYYPDKTNTNSDKLKISATAKYSRITAASGSGQYEGTRTVVAYMALDREDAQLAASSGIIPTDNVFYVDGDSGFNTCNLIGNAYVNGKFTFSNGSKVTGRVIARSDVTFTGGTHSTSELICFGNVSMSGGGRVEGDLMLKGSGTMGNGAYVGGNVYAEKGFTYNDGTIGKDLYSKNYLNLNGGRVYGNAYANGNFSLAGGNVSGNVKTNGYLTVTGGAYVNGNASSDSYMTISNGTINRNAATGTSATLSWGGKIYGNLTYYGSFSKPDYSNLVSGTVTKLSDPYVPPTTPDQLIPLRDFTPYIGPVLPIISLEKEPTDPPPYSNYTITGSGKITTAFINTLKSHSYGTTIRINADTKDIVLLLDNTNFDTGNGLKFEVVGNYNVFIYLKGNVQFNLTSNQYFGMYPRGNNPKLFIIGDGTGTQAINLTNNSELDACVYMPKGSFFADGSPLTTYKFIGSCTVKTVTINSNVSVFYSKPIIKDTPLEILNISPPAEAVTTTTVAGSVSWELESWSN